MSEIWTAIEKKDDLFVFDVLNEQTKQTRKVELYGSGVQVKLVLGGYPPQMGLVMAITPPPWRFLVSDGGNIYLDGPPIGGPNYNPIDPPASPAGGADKAGKE